jgi:hypothetical protein
MGFINPQTFLGALLRKEGLSSSMRASIVHRRKGCKSVILRCFWVVPIILVCPQRIQIQSVPRFAHGLPLSMSMLDRMMMVPWVCKRVLTAVNISLETYSTQKMK